MWSNDSHLGLDPSRLHSMDSDRAAVHPEYPLQSLESAPHRNNNTDSSQPNQKNIDETIKDLATHTKHHIAVLPLVTPYPTEQNHIGVREYTTIARKIVYWLKEQCDQQHSVYVSLSNLCDDARNDPRPAQLVSKPSPFCLFLSFSFAPIPV